MIATLILLIVIIMFCGFSISSTYQTATHLNTYTNTIAFKQDLMLAKMAVLSASTTFTVNTETEIEDEVVTSSTIYHSLPAGKDLSGFYTLPDYLLKPKNPYGYQYIYCPFSLLEEEEYAYTITNGSDSYPVNLSTLQKNGRSFTYVMSTPKSNFTENGILGFIISPYKPLTPEMNCGNIIFDENLNNFILDGTRIETITIFEVEGFNR